MLFGISAGFFACRVNPGSKSDMNILFLCSGNSVRSQMAEGWARHLGDDNLEAKSAGIFASNLHSLAIEVMHRAGVDISQHEAKPVSNDLMNWADIIVTLCDTVKPLQALFPKSISHRHWAIPNPDNMVNEEMSQEEAYTQVRDEIREKIETLLTNLNHIKHRK